MERATKERTTKYQVIGNDGTVLYYDTYLCNCKRWVRKHFTFDELSGRGGYVKILDKVTPRKRLYDYLREDFPVFKSRSDGLFRRYIYQTIVTPARPAAIVNTNCVAYIINTFHENHLV